MQVIFFFSTNCDPVDTLSSVPFCSVLIISLLIIHCAKIVTCMSGNVARLPLHSNGHLLYLLFISFARSFWCVYDCVPSKWDENYTQPLAIDGNFRCKRWTQNDIGNVLMQNKLSYFDLFSLLLFSCLLAFSLACTKHILYCLMFMHLYVSNHIIFMLNNCLTFKYISIETALLCTPLLVKLPSVCACAYLFSFTTSFIFIIANWTLWLDAEWKMIQNISSTS